jgi:hypothetical protein
MMISSDPKLREQLRDLPTGYLLDLLADHTEADQGALRSVLQERGLERDEIERLVLKRLNSRLPRGHALWKAARIYTLACASLLAIFNIITFYRLLHGTSPIKGLILTLLFMGLAFGFFLGYKLTTHLYQGGRHQLDCGFPLPIGSVDLQTGRETIRTKPILILCMAVNATVGLALVLFPLLLICHVLD